MTTEADLEAICDVLGELSDEADGMAIERAVEMRDHLTLVGDALTRARNQLETSIKGQLESPRKIGRLQYSIRPNGTTRFDHVEIGRRILRRANSEYAEAHEGEIPDPAVAAAVLRAFTTIFLSNSSKAKLSALKNLLGVDDPFQARIARWEKSGKTEIVITELEEM